MSNEIEIALIGGASGALFGGIASLIVAVYQMHSQESSRIKEDINGIINHGIQYPYFETDAYCMAWEPSSTLVGEECEKSCRYEIYCCHVFNTIERLWRLHTYFGFTRKSKVNNELACRELIHRHGKWFWSDKENYNGYDPSLFKYISEIYPPPTSHQ